MSKKSEIEEVAELLVTKGMDYGMAWKNLLETDRYFIEGLLKILK